MTFAAKISIAKTTAKPKQLGTVNFSHEFAALRDKSGKCYFISRWNNTLPTCFHKPPSEISWTHVDDHAIFAAPNITSGFHFLSPSSSVHLCLWKVALFTVIKHLKWQTVSQKILKERDNVINATVSFDNLLGLVFTYRVRCWMSRFLGSRWQVNLRCSLLHSFSVCQALYKRVLKSGLRKPLKKKSGPDITLFNIWLKIKKEDQLLPKDNK